MDWNKAVEFAVTVAVMAIAAFLVPWLKEKLGAEKLQKLQELIVIAVRAAEQIFGPKTGAEKKAYVQRWLKAQGVKADPERVDAMIEAAVLALE